MSNVNMMAVSAKNDENLKNNLIAQYENFILKCASSAAQNYISKSDDEWSIALAAFIEALNNYSPEKGSFLNFSELVIRRRIIDFIRSKSRYAPEISVNPSLFGHDVAEEDYFIQSEIVQKLLTTEDNSIRLEIYLINEIFFAYGFSFMDLIECSPKAEKTKRACGRVVAFMIKNSILTSEMKVKKQLPLNIIQKNTKVPRKLLEHHRKYIVASVEIMSGDYPYLASYMGYISEELEK